MALVLALTLLALQGAYSASLPEPSPGRLQDLLTALPDKQRSGSGAHGEPLTLIIGKDVKRVFSRKGLPNKPAASRMIRPWDRHLDPTRLNDSELHSPEPALSLLDNVSLQEPDDIVLRNAVAQLLQEVEDRQAKKHKQHSNAKSNHKTSSITKDTIKIDNIADHSISPNLNVKVIEGSHDGRASSNIESDNSQQKVSFENTTNVRNEVVELSGTRHENNKIDESNKAMLTLDNLLKSIELSRDSSNKRTDYDFDDKKEKIGQDYDGLNNTLKKDIKEHDNLSTMELQEQDTNNKNLVQQNELNRRQSQERNDEVDSNNKLNSNDYTRSNNDNENHGLVSFKPEENESKLHQSSQDNHISMEPIAVSKQNDVNLSHNRNDSNHLEKVDNLITKESREFKDQNHLKQNNIDIDKLPKSNTDQAELALNDNLNSVLRLASSLNDYGYNDENLNDKEKTGDSNDKLVRIIEETNKDYYDHLKIKQDKKHSEDKPNDSRVYWVDVKSENTRQPLREDDNQVEENFDDSNSRSVPKLLRALFDDGLEKQRTYVDDRHQEKANDYDDDIEDHELNELWNNAVHKNDKNHGLIDVNESMYDKNNQLNKQKPHNVYKKPQTEMHHRHRQKDHHGRKYDLDSYETDDHQSCRESKKTFTLSFHFKK